MCVAFLFLKARGDASRAPAVVLCVNRDEAFGRPTLPSHWWEDAPDVFAGRDLEAMGTWCGVSRTGRVAVLTNYTEEPTATNETGNAAYRPSRGALAADFLRGSPERRDDDGENHIKSHPPSPTTYAARVATTRDAYAGFNLIVGDCVTGEFVYVGNRGDAAGDGSPVRLDDQSPPAKTKTKTVAKDDFRGVARGVSNATLATPWPKVVAGEARLTDAVVAYARGSNPGQEREETDENRDLAAFATDALRAVLQNDGTWRPSRRGARAGDDEKKTDDDDDDDDDDDERIPLATNPSAFVAPGAAPRLRGAYGTRCSTVVAVRADRKVAVVAERTLAWSAEGGDPGALGSGVWSAPAATSFEIAPRR